MVRRGLRRDAANHTRDACAPHFQPNHSCSGEAGRTSQGSAARQSYVEGIGRRRNELILESLLAPHRCVAIAALIAECLDCQYLEIVRAKTLTPAAPPIINMVGSGDRVVCAQRRSTPVVQILPKSRSALNGRLAYLLMLVEVVGMPVTADGVDHRSTRNRAFLADVIFNERTGRPPVDAEIIIAAVQGADVVADRVRGAGVPAFAGNHIADVAPGDGEIAGVCARAWKGDARGSATDVTLPEEAVVRARAGVCRHGCAARDERGED